MVRPGTSLNRFNRCFHLAIIEVEVALHLVTRTDEYYFREQRTCVNHYEALFCSLPTDLQQLLATSLLRTVTALHNQDTCYGIDAFTWEELLDACPKVNFVLRPRP